MHPRNPYKNSPDFVALGDAFPELKQFLKPTQTGATIDYQNQTALRCLTRALLHRDFGLSITLLEDRLCPPVPNRLNYILWLQDILDATETGPAEQRTVRGIDIGTGASAIYPLLGCATNSNWNFLATEIDNKSLANARQNVAGNSLESRIRILQVDPKGCILPYNEIEKDGLFDFTMCNPPFYRDREEVASSTEAKEIGPNAVCTGADTEMITAGGEMAFVQQMVSESIHIGTRCRWYTSMLGKMSSLAEIVDVLRTNKIDNFGITEFVQGKTRRWAIAWSFGSAHLPDVLARIPNPALQHIMPPRNTLRQPLTEFNARVAAESALDALLQDIDGVSVVTQSTKPQPGTLVQAIQNTWSRAARRRKAAGALSSTQEHYGSPALRCRIRFCEARSEKEEAAQGYGMIVEFVWVEGSDRALFESFMSHVSRKLKEAAKASDVEMAG